MRSPGLARLITERDHMNDHRIALLQAENERLKGTNARHLGALERLASVECFVQPGMISPECRARMKYAEDAMVDDPSPDQSDEICQCGDTDCSRPFGHEEPGR